MLPANMRPLLPTHPPTTGVEGAIRQPAAQAQPTSQPTVSFRDVLFSKHAALRLDSRDIKLSDEQISRLGKAIGRAQEKGIRDSLVLMDDVALVVNVRSRTVITAMNRTENVFSNIDGAVIV